MATDLEPLQEENEIGAALEGGAWTEHLGFNVAVEDQEKDLKYIPNWRADHVIEGLKDLARAGGYSVLSLCGSVAVLKRFDHQVKLAHCYRAPGDKLYVWAPAPDHLPPPPPPEVSTFATMCDDLRTHLRLTGTNVQVLAAACPQLGVAETSGTSEERAARCHAILLGGPPPPAAAPDPSRAAAPDAADAGPDAGAAATDLRVRVSCPAGASAGDVVTTTLPDGRSIRAPIPAGLAPGEAFTIRVPALPGSTDEEVPVQAMRLEASLDIEVPAGRLGLHFDVGNSHRVVRVSHSSPLAFRVDVGNRLVSIRAPGRSLFVCGPNTYGQDIVRELQAAAAGPGRVLSFAVARAARPAPTGGTREVRAPSGPLMGAETVPEPEGRQSEQQSRDWLSLEMGNSRRSGTLAPEHPGRARSSRRHQLASSPRAAWRSRRRPGDSDSALRPAPDTRSSACRRRARSRAVSRSAIGSSASERRVASSTAAAFAQAATSSPSSERQLAPSAS